MIRPKTLKYIVQETGINFLSWNLIAEGFFNHEISKKYTGTILTVGIMYIKSDVGLWAPDISEWNHAGRQLMERIGSGRFNLNRLMAEHHQAGRGIFEVCEKVKKSDLKTSINQYCALLLKKLWKHYYQLNSLGFIPVISDYDNFALTERLVRVLADHGVKDSDRQKYLSLLSSSTRPVLNWKEQLDLLILTRKSRSLSAIKKSKELSRHIDKYSWLNYGYQGPDWKERDFLDRIKKIRSSPVPIRQQIEEHRSHFKKLKNQQNKLFKALKLSSKEKFYFVAAQEFMYLKAYRTVCRHYLNYVSDLVFTELGRKYHVPIAAFRYALKKEILEWLAGKNSNFSSLAKRRKAMLYVTEGKKDYFVKPGKIKKFLAPLLIEEEVINRDHVNGQTAYLGKVRGRVKIVNGVKDMSKVKKGDVLVAVSTNPDVLPAMNRAAAFVTDVGGITSHAAIIAREMKKTCVIGTKFATKIFQDGDMVEVDAMNGVVKKIN